MKPLTKTQQNLLNELSKIITNEAIKYDTLKKVVKYQKDVSNHAFSSFDATFNALYNKGYVKRVETNNFDNKFILTPIK